MSLKAKGLLGAEGRELHIKQLVGAGTLLHGAFGCCKDISEPLLPEEQ